MMPVELRSLFERYNQLGCLLPQATALADADVRAEAQIILREMTSVKAQIDLFLTAAARERSLT